MKNLIFTVGIAASLSVGAMNAYSLSQLTTKIESLEQVTMDQHETKARSIEAFSTEIEQFDTNMASIQEEVQSMGSDLDSALSLSEKVEKIEAFLSGGTNFK